MNHFESIKSSITNYLNEITIIQNDFEQLKKNPDLFIFEYFLNLRTNIDLYAEEAIYAIQSTQSILIEEIKAYEKECLLRAENVNENLINKIEKIIDLNLNERTGILCDVHETQLELLRNDILEDKKDLITNIENLKSDLMMQKNFIFIQKNFKPPSYLFGDLMITNFYTENIENDLFR